MFFILPHKFGRIDRVAVFIPAMSVQRIHTFTLSLSPSPLLSLVPSYEVNIFCRKADGELVLTTSRSASQSLQSSHQPHCVSAASVSVCVCVCLLEQCGISMADLYLTVHLQ